MNPSRLGLALGLAALTGLSAFVLPQAVDAADFAYRTPAEAKAPVSAKAEKGEEALAALAQNEAELVDLRDANSFGTAYQPSLFLYDNLIGTPTTGRPNGNLNASGTRYTALMCNAVTLDEPGPQQITSFSWVGFNANAAAYTTSTTNIVLYDDTGIDGGPGKILHMASGLGVASLSFGVVPYPVGAAQYNAAPFGYRGILVPAADGVNATVWACARFSDSNANAASLANQGLAKYTTTTTAGTTTDKVFVQTIGAATIPNNPAGTITAGGDNSFGWRLNTQGLKTLVDSYEVKNSTSGAVAASTLQLNPATGAGRNFSGYAATIAAPTAVGTGEWNVSGVVLYPHSNVVQNASNLQVKIQFWDVFNGPTAADVFGFQGTPIAAITVNAGAFNFASASSVYNLPVYFDTPVALGSATTVGITVQYLVDTGAGPVNDGSVTNVVNTPTVTTSVPSVGANASSGANANSGFYKSDSNRADLNFTGIGTDFDNTARRHLAVRVYGDSEITSAPAQQSSATATTTTLPANIPDNAPTAGLVLEFPVSGITGALTDIKLHISGTHTYASDMTATLAAPGGSPSRIVFGSGDSSDFGGPYTFSDAASLGWVSGAIAATDLEAIPAGTYRPTAANGMPQSLSAPFIGMVDFGSNLVNGNWTLTITDGFAADTGTITAASLELTYLASTYTVGGTVSGLTASGLELTLNGGTPLAVTSGASAFLFTDELLDGAAYDVQVSAQPTGQTCVASNNTGTIAGADVINVAITCTDIPVANNELLTVDLSVVNRVTITATTGVSLATISGPTNTGFYLQGMFSNAGTFTHGAFTLAPPGTLTAASVASDGTPALFRLNTTEPGLNVYSYSATTPTTFTSNAVAFTGTGTWTVTPAAYTALLTAPASGNVLFPADDQADIPTATVLGTWRILGVDPTYSVGGTITGLTATGLQLTLNGGAPLSVVANATSFVFPTELLNGATYNVQVSAQPANAVCTASSNTGTIAGADVGNVAINCVSTGAPAISATPSPVVVSAEAGSTGSSVLTIANVGGGSLTWAIAEEEGLVAANATLTYNKDTSLQRVSRSSDVRQPLPESYLDYGTKTQASSSNLTSTYTDQATFLAAVDAGYYAEAFNSVTEGSQGTPLVFSSGGFGYSIFGATGSLYNGDGFISLDLAADQIVITFTSGNVTAVGGNLWATDIGFNPLGSPIIATLNDGSTVTVPVSAANTFIGFTSDTPITSLTIDAPDSPATAWPTLDNLVVGAAGGAPPADPCDNPSDVSWLVPTPTSGSVPGGAFVAVDVDVDASALTPGSYTANLCVTSNDTAAPLVVVPVNLTVTTGNPPGVIVSVNPTELESTQYVDTITTQPLTISNGGDQAATWSIIESNAVNLGTPVELYDNGSMITHPTGGAGGAPASALQTALAMSLYGAGAQNGQPNFVADDFTVTGATGWDIDTFTFYSYQTGSSTTSTLNGVFVAVYDGDPSAGGTLVFGNSTSNVLGSTSFSGVYRSIDTDIANAQRPIMAVTTQNLGLHLDPGTYWVVYSFTGSLASGPWAPPVTIVGNATTGNAKQSLAGVWGNFMDTGSNTPQGLPFKIIGTSGTGGSTCTLANASWLSVSPASGTTAPGGSTNTTVTFDSTGLAPGTYNHKLCVQSNDTEGNELIEVPVELVVENVPTSPELDLEVTVALDNGNPAQCGTADTITVQAYAASVNVCYTLTNNSLETLRFQTLEDSDAGALLTNAPITLAPGESHQHNRVFMPTAAGTITPTATWTAKTALSDAYLADATAPFVYTNITTTGTDLALTDDSSATVTLPFPVTFYGVTSTNLRVNNNGAAAFNTTAGTVTYSNAALPSANLSAALGFAPFWDDMGPGDTAPAEGGVYFQTLGTAPNRVAVVEWYRSPYGQGGNTINVQLLLGEDGSIVYNYADVTTVAANTGGASATIGLQGAATGTAFTQFSYNTASVTDNQAIAWEFVEAVELWTSDTYTVVVTPGEPPIIAVDPIALVAVQAPNTTTTQTLNIANEGEATLNWELNEAGVATVQLDLSTEQARKSAVNAADVVRRDRVEPDSRLVNSYGKLPEFVPAWVAPPQQPQGNSVSLVLDDGTDENGIGLTQGGQIIWLNRFTPAANAFPFRLNEVQVLFSASSGGNVGETVDIYVYTDTDGDPSNGATLAGSSLGLVVTELDAFNTFPVSIDLTTPGDVLIAVVNRTFAIAAGTFAAALDEDTSAERSWIGFDTAGGTIANPPVLPLTNFLLVDDAIGGGNWLIRGFGGPGVGCTAPEDIAWLSVSDTTGSLDEGEDTDVTVTFNSTGLALGEYEAVLCVESNDPANPVVEVPVNLTVQSSDPAIFSDGFEED